MLNFKKSSKKILDCLELILSNGASTHKRRHAEIAGQSFSHLSTSFDKGDVLRGSSSIEGSRAMFTNLFHSFPCEARSIISSGGGCGGGGGGGGA